MPSIIANYVRPPNAGVGTGNITITNTPGQNTTRQNTSNFKALEIGIYGNVCNPNSDDTKFRTEQRVLRALDCMKDGSVGAANISNQIYGILFSTLGQGDKPDPDLTLYHNLGALEAKFMGVASASAPNNFGCMKNKVQRLPWTKEKKGTIASAAAQKLTHRNVFKESGLDAFYFTNINNYIKNFANEVIDPAARGG
jgi:hypothetical protein